MCPYVPLGYHVEVLKHGLGPTCSMIFNQAGSTEKHRPAPSKGSLFIPLVSAFYLMSHKGWGQTQHLANQSLLLQVCSSVAANGWHEDGGGFPLGRAVPRPLDLDSSRPLVGRVVPESLESLPGLE